MKIGLAKEIKKNEGRVALTPSDIATLVKDGHIVWFETDCGVLSGFENIDYLNAGARETDHKGVFANAEMLVKVKELQASEFDLTHEGQIIVCYFHLTGNKPLTDLVLSKKITAIDYEYVVDQKSNRRAITLSPIAGRLGILLGMQGMYSIYGGRGVLPMGVPGVEAAEITIIGAGDAGMGAIKTAIGLNMNVNILEVSTRRLEELENLFGNKAKYLISSRGNLEKALKTSDVFVNCVLWDKLRTDHLINRSDLKLMKKNALIIDISCDINGAIETCRATSHDNPMYVEEGIIHYCVDNIPGAVPVTSTKYLCAQSFPYIRAIAKNPLLIKDNAALKGATLAHNGSITNSYVGLKWNLEVKSL